MERGSRTLIEQLGFNDVDRKNPSHDEIQLWAYRNFRSVVVNVFPELKQENGKFDVRLEYLITNNGHTGFVVGFVDIYSPSLSIAIEVKTKIPFVGDLIRQIKFYQKYIGGRWIVVSPDERSAEILLEQGIHFYRFDARILSTQIQSIAQYPLNF